MRWGRGKEESDRKDNAEKEKRKENKQKGRNGQHENRRILSYEV